MNNILKPTQSTATLCRRKTIQRQAAEIEELKSKLEFKSICLSAALADLQRMDGKLVSAQDDFFNLGDACMNRLTGLESPFQYE